MEVAPVTDVNSAEACRLRIYEIDVEIIDLIAKRFAITDQVADLKARECIAITDTGREKQIFEKVARDAEEMGIPTGPAIDFFRFVIDESKARQGRRISKAIAPPNSD
jgi:chorismate mutase